MRLPQAVMGARTMINGERVKQARELKGLTQNTIAKRLKITHSAISQIESGQIQPSEAILQGIAFQCGFPPAFFQQEDFVDFPLGSLLFRSRSTMTKTERAKALQLARTVYEQYSYLARRIKKVPVSIPRLNEDAAAAARLTRSALGLSPDAPILNLIRSIERAGVIVLGLPGAFKNTDAFSTWVVRHELAPVIVLLATNSGDRLRYSVAHELGHLVMHHMVFGELPKLEAEANQFAAELLMPAEGISCELEPPITIESLLKLKQRWKVSMQALARRAYDLGTVTQGQYKYIMQQISKRGWRKNEPNPLPVEQPRALRKMAELVFGVPLSYRRFAGAVNHPLSLVRETLQAHAGKALLAIDRKIPTTRKVLDLAEYAQLRSVD